MSIPLFTVTGSITRLLGGDISTSVFTNREIVFTPNIATGTLIPVDGNLARVDPVTAQLGSDGSVTLHGAPLTLLANDPAHPLLVALSWTVSPAPSWPRSNTSFKPWTFVAGAPGDTVTLNQTAKVPLLLSLGYIQGVPGHGVDNYTVLSDGRIQWYANGVAVGAPLTLPGGGIADIVADTTPQLGGNLDLNGHNVGAATAADLAKLHGTGTLSGNNTGDQDLSNYATTAAMTTAIANAVNALVNGAPGALDTLKELADAIGDNASYAAAITTALAGKVATSLTINGHALTGNITLTSADLADVVRTVLVTTGSEARPSTTGAVLWIGGTTEPTNIAAGDIWLSAATVAASTTGLLTARTATQGGSHTYTIASGTVTQIDGTTVNGLTMAVGDLVLINQAPAASGANSGDTTQPGNGLYAVDSIAGGNIALSRVPAMSGSNSPIGALIYVVQGDAGGTIKRVTSPSSGAFTYGTTTLAIGDAFIAGSASNDIVQYSLNHPPTNTMSFSATPTFDLGSNFQFNMTLTGAITSATFSNGVDGKMHRFRFKDNGTAHALALGSTVRAIGITIPTTTVANKNLYLIGVWNAADSKLDIIDVKQEA